MIGHSMGAASAAMATMLGLAPKGLVMIAPPLSHRRRMERVAERLELESEVRERFFVAAERRVGWKDTDVDMRVVARRRNSRAAGVGSRACQSAKVIAGRRREG